MNTLSNRQPWLNASLLPPKIYSVFAAVWLVVWHARLPLNRMDGTRNFFDFRWELAARDFACAAHFVVLGYFLAAAVLLLGAACQLWSGSRKGGYVSLAFAGAAVVLGFLLGPFQYEGLSLVL